MLLCWIYDLNQSKYQSRHLRNKLIPFIRYVKGHAPSSMNVLASQLSSYANILKKLNRKYHVVIANEGEGGPEVSYGAPHL